MIFFAKICKSNNYKGFILLFVHLAKKNGNYPLTSKNKSNNIDVYPEHNVILSVTKNLFFRSFTSLRMTSQ